jgi:hypothetical protein
MILTVIRWEWERSDASFGDGYCTSLGKNFAMMEICKVVVEVCLRFFL